MGMTWNDSLVGEFSTDSLGLPSKMVCVLFICTIQILIVLREVEVVQYNPCKKE